MYVVVSIEESKDVDAISINELQSTLAVHYQMFKKVDRGEQVLKVTLIQEYRNRLRRP